MPETVQITNFEIIPFCRDFFQGWFSLARLPRVASPSFVKRRRQKHYGAQESTSEGRQPGLNDHHPFGIEDQWKVRESGAATFPRHDGPVTI